MRQIASWFDLTSVAEGRPVVVLGLPWEGAVSGRAGASGGPAAVRRWSRTEQAVDEHGRPVAGLRVIDLGDVAGGPEAIEAAAHEALAERPDARLLAIGGDHSVTPPLVRAVRARHRRLGLVVLDAHPDLFAAYEGDPGSHACAVARAWDAGVAPAATALVGLRSCALDELPALARAGTAVAAAEWLRDGPDAVARRVAGALGDRPVYLSLDIDVLDPAAAPGTGYPVAGGPSSRALLDLLARLMSGLDVVAVDLVEVAPALDPTEITAATAAHVLLQVLAGWARRETGAGAARRAAASQDA